MKWSPPRIEHCRPPKFRFSLCSTMLALMAAAAMAGCSSIPVLTAARPLANLQPALATTPPVFDIIPSQTSATTVAAKPPVENKPASTGTLSAPKPVGTEERQAQAAPSSTAPSSTAPSSTVAKTETVPTAKPETPKVPATTPQPSAPAVAMADPVRVGTQKPSGVRVTPPKPFTWVPTGKSSGGRPFQIVSPGDDGYRTLVIGSVGGNDPLALELVELLAKRLHDDSLILGGYDCTIVRTLNPDGEANRRFLNQNGDYINESFPKIGEKSAAKTVKEVEFILLQLQSIQPQRVVHIRTIKGATGVIAASASCQTVAKEAADWLKFRLVALPNADRPESSLERYVATTGSSDMLTFGIPDTTPRNELWERYGDTLLNLLLRDDLTTRELARKQSQQSSADRRNQSP